MSDTRTPWSVILSKCGDPYISVLNALYVNAGHDLGEGSLICDET